MSNSSLGKRTVADQREYQAMKFEASKAIFLKKKAAKERESELQNSVGKKLWQNSLFAQRMPPPCSQEELHSGPNAVAVPARIKSAASSSKLKTVSVPPGFEGVRIMPQETPQKKTGSQSSLLNLRIKEEESDGCEQLTLPALRVENPFWCDICKVPCCSAFNLVQHNQGRRHKAKQVLLSSGSDKAVAAAGNMIFWCHECKVPCMNEFSLVQHRAGKKHASRPSALGAIIVSVEDTQLHKEKKLKTSSNSTV